MLFLYDTISYDMDGNIKNYKELIKLVFLKMDKKWYCSELIGRLERKLSMEVLEEYDRFWNTVISDKK
ncbi:hypothetical protein [uncultured Eubacterium sp.]|uniref:hypothetical protein n=1 Tax=uncultured Eubacterium sp. TaxID=165185 RepID=UPI002673ED9E|nr:hypothetical protein [uncultured Eubacterium sp.]